MLTLLLPRQKAKRQLKVLLQPLQPLKVPLQPLKVPHQPLKALPRPLMLQRPNDSSRPDALASKKLEYDPVVQTTGSFFRCAHPLTRCLPAPFAFSRHPLPGIPKSKSKTAGIQQFAAAHGTRSPKIAPLAGPIGWPHWLAPLAGPTGWSHWLAARWRPECYRRTTLTDNLRINQQPGH
ncbi:hypothetical protein LBMAG46_41040 [Planctomycetia bacterium]|nr:hypothetical protein LBMAG46_41040 [Planctomycetia bacterium]